MGPDRYWPSDSRRQLSTTLSVVHVLWSGHVGGVERLVTDLAVAQVRSDIDVRVAFCQSGSPYAAMLDAVRVPVLDLGMRSGYDFSPRVLSNAALELAASDVVHLHGFNLPLAVATRRAARPIVYTEHGFTPRPAIDVGAHVKRQLKQRFLTHRVAAIVANSDFTASRLSSFFRIPSRLVHVVYNGIDVERLPLPIEPLRSDGLLLACVSRLVGWKRLDRALRALAITEQSDIRMVIVGDGPSRPELERQAADLHLGDRVTFLGFQNDVPAIVSRADILMQPSAAEWFGLAVVEGCAQGLLPVVFTDAGGALEVLPPDGIAVTDVRELGLWLSELRGHPLLTMEARNRRSDWARNAFPITRTARAYESVYRFALSSATAY